MNSLLDCHRPVPSSPTPTDRAALPLLPSARVRLAAVPPPPRDSGFRFPAANFPFPFPFSAPPSRPYFLAATTRRAATARSFVGRPSGLRRAPATNSDSYQVYMCIPMS